MKRSSAIPATATPASPSDGQSADACNLTTASSYTEEGQYTVYYEITYTCQGEEMTENGVAYVWLRDEAPDADGADCACGCGKPDCDCKKDDGCNGSCNSCGSNHNFTKPETASPSCLGLGYTRYLCAGCGKVEKCDYTAALGHAWQSIVIREATCETDGKVLETCRRCGETNVVNTPKGEYRYETHSAAATCERMGYTAYTCENCGLSYKTDYLQALDHDYAAAVTAPTCTAGHRHRECGGCGAVLEQETLDKLGNTGDTDGKGEERVGGYLVIVTDTSTGNPVADALVVLNRDGTFSIRLPRGRLLDSEKRTTVTILLKKDRSPLSGLGITVTDRNDNRAAGRTKARGQLTVPAASGSTGGNTTVGGKDDEDEKRTLTVKGSQGQSAGGETDKDGKLVVPAGRARHSAYIVGYPDGTFGPGRTMTRAEASAIFARLLAEKKEEKIPAAAYTRFRDVPFASWYSGYVQYLGGYGVVVGRTGGVFAPDAPITRVAVRFLAAYGGETKTAGQYFGFYYVASSDWSAAYIQEAALRGWGSATATGPSGARPPSPAPRPWRWSTACWRARRTRRMWKRTSGASTPSWT